MDGGTGKGEGVRKEREGRGEDMCLAYGGRELAMCTL